MLVTAWLIAEFFARPFQGLMRSLFFEDYPTFRR